MKHIKLFEDFVNENLSEWSDDLVTEKVAPKDWDRMADLYIKDGDGKKVAKLIKNKTKAINRYVAGLKIVGKTPEFSPGDNIYGDFSDIGRKAMELGATKDEIKTAYDSAGDVPQSTLDKISNLASKRLGNWVVGPISNAVLKAGGDINFLDKGGRSITSDGKHAMSTSGRNWTIGYKTKLKINNKEYQFDFDVITDEGQDRSNRYVIANSTSKELTSNSGDFKKFQTDLKTYGIRDFEKTLKYVIEELAD